MNKFLKRLICKHEMKREYEIILSGLFIEKCCKCGQRTFTDKYNNVWDLKISDKIVENNIKEGWNKIGDN